MPVCDAGSERQSGTPVTVTIDPLYMAGLLPAGTEWLRPYIPFLQPITINLDDFCALDPPEDPDLTAADLIALVPPSNFNLVELAAFKLTQLLHIFAWYRFCRCSDGTTPDPFTPPSAPAGAPIINPPGQTYVPAGACRVDVVTVNFLGGSESQAYGPVCTTSSCTAFVAPTGATSVRVTVAIDNPDNNEVRADVFGLSANPYTAVTTNPVQIGRNAHLGAYANFLDGFSDTNVWTAAWTQPYFACHVSHTGGASPPRPTFSATFTLEWFCPLDPTPCISCPPDPYLLGRLDSIMAALLDTRVQVELIQRQAAPFGYIPGDVHAGVTGNGEIAVSGLIGMAVEITTDVGAAGGADDGTPDYLYGRGWFNWGSADGYTERRRLTSELSVSFPPTAGVYTTFAYSLPPGLVVTLTELVREP